MKKRILIISTIIVLIMSLFAVNSVMALSEVPTTGAQATLEPKYQQVVSEGENIVEIKITSLNFTSGLASVSGTLIYDETIFEQVNETNFDALNDWVVSYNAVDKKVSFARGAGKENQKDAGSLARISFKVKDNAMDKSGVIKLENVTFSNGYEPDFILDSIATPNIKVGNTNIEYHAESPTEVIPITDPTPQPEPQPQPEPEKPTIDKKPEDIPETGIVDTFLPIASVLVALAILFYMNYKRLSRKNVRYVDVE